MFKYFILSGNSEMFDKMLPLFSGIFSSLELCSVTAGCECEAHNSLLCGWCLRATAAGFLPPAYLSPLLRVTLVSLLPSKATLMPTSVLLSLSEMPSLPSVSIPLGCHLLRKTCLSF